MSTWRWPSVAELERTAAVETGRDYARERQENAEALRVCDELETLDKERAADGLEVLLAGWADPLTGLPPAGMESPRFRTPREARYIEWVRSEGGRRTRENLYGPDLEERIAANQAAADRFYSEVR